MGLFHWWRQASVVDRAALERFGARHADVGLMVEPGVLQREAPCHVDGFQGARWDPKVRLNHTYTMGDAVPTTYYEQPFDFTRLDEKVHNFLGIRINVWNAVHSIVR